jgi:hypothetical protein
VLLRVLLDEATRQDDGAGQDAGGNLLVLADVEDDALPLSLLELCAADLGNAGQRVTDEVFEVRHGRFYIPPC